MPPVDALVTDVHLRSVVNGLRGLGRAGVRVHAVGESGFSAGLLSRFAAARSVAPRSRDDPEGFAEAISRLVERDGRRRRRVVVYPGQDRSIDALQDTRSALPAVAAMACCEASALDALRDKGELAKLAHRNEIRTPAILARGRAAELKASALPTPCIVKFAKPGLGEARLVRMPADLTAFADQAPGDAELLVQEPEPGPLTALAVVLSRDGRLVERFQQRALRTWPPGAGTSSVAVSVAPDEELTQRVGAMLASVGFWGMAQLQFVGADADAALIDFNPRFYGSLPLALAAGANLPARWHSVVLSEPAGSPTDYTIGVTYRWLEAELLAARRNGSARLERLPQPRTGAMWARDDPVASLGLATGAAMRALRAKLGRPGADKSRRLAIERDGPGRFVK